MINGDYCGCFLNKTVACSAKSKNTILAFAFLPMSVMALEISSDSSTTCASFTYGAKRLTKFSSSAVI